MKLQPKFLTRDELVEVLEATLKNVREGSSEEGTVGYKLTPLGLYETQAFIGLSTTPLIIGEVTEDE